MLRVLIGTAAIAAAMASPAIAAPEDANLWAVTENGADGLLIDELTGQAWLTGTCLKPLASVTNSGEIWQSQTVELVWVGRTRVVLDQTFTLDASSGRNATLMVESANRGGPQRFPVTVERDCQSSPRCRGLLDAPIC
ncbi:MAG: hypothetical protein AAF950_00400 [Pseudomonadota bacterium]